jgi:hypothetical protein
MQIANLINTKHGESLIFEVVKKVFILIQHQNPPTPSSPQPSLLSFSHPEAFLLLRLNYLLDEQDWRCL